MKVNRLETHDRLQHFIQDQSASIAQGAQECLKLNSLSLALQEKSHYIYIYAHPRTHDDGVTQRMLWQPRLTKPKMEENSYLFRAQSKTDNLEICWLLPPKNLWAQYIKGNVTEHELVIWSIEQYKHNRARMEEKEPDDLQDHVIEHVYQQVRAEHKQDKLMNQMNSNLKLLRV